LREVPEQDAINYAKQFEIPYAEVSAKTGEGVEKMFVDFIRHAHRHPPPTLGVCRSINIKKAV